jgi:hypothetical protein
VPGQNNQPLMVDTEQITNSDTAASERPEANAEEEKMREELLQKCNKITASNVK